MKKSGKILLKILPYFLAVVTFFVGLFVGNGVLDKDVRAVKDLVEKYKQYYYFEEGNIIDLVSGALLDDYSSYYTKEEYQKVKDGAKGYTDGIGLRIDNTTNKIRLVLYNSPCDLAGIKAGGIVKKVIINGTEYENIKPTLSQTIIGQSIGLVIDYNGTLKEYNIVKSNYKQTFVKYIDNTGEYSFRGNNGIRYQKISENSFVTNSSIGYLKYTSFSGKDSGLEGSVGQFDCALDNFKNAGKSTLILDLRDNGGGYVDVLEQIASMVLPTTNGSNAVICVSTDKRGYVEKFTSKAVTFEDYNIKKLVILANSMSASASEVLIGAILDYASNYSSLELSVLISDENSGNTSTYGKGIMQTTYLNLDGSAVKLTSAKLTTPLTYRSIHGVGFNEDFDSRIQVVSENDILNYAMNL